MTPAPQLSEKSMQVLEANIPKLARDALERAYYDALTLSGKVMQAMNGQLVETTAEGEVRVIRHINAPLKVIAGTRRSRRAAQP